MTEWIKEGIRRILFVFFDEFTCKPNTLKFRFLKWIYGGEYEYADRFDPSINWDEECPNCKAPKGEYHVEDCPQIIELEADNA